MLYLFNTTIMPNEGVYVNRKVTLDEALEIIGKFGPTRQFGEGIPTTETSRITSAIGHQGSADAMNSLGLNIWGTVEVNRIQATMEPGDQAIALKVLGRLPEGSILTLEELEKIGFEFYHITNLGCSVHEHGSVYNSALGYLTPVEKYTHQK